MKDNSIDIARNFRNIDTSGWLQQTVGNLAQTRLHFVPPQPAKPSAAAVTQGQMANDSQQLKQNFHKRDRFPGRFAGDQALLERPRLLAKPASGLAFR